MTVWGDIISLVDARSAPAHEKVFWSGMTDGTFVKVHGDFWADSIDWQQLAPWTQERVKTLVVGHCAHQAIIVGRSAVRLWGLPLLKNGLPIEMALPDGRKPPGRSKWTEGIRYRSMKLVQSEVRSWKGIRVTTAERSLIDYCRWTSFAEGLAAVEAFCRTHRKNKARLEKETTSAGRIPHIGRVRKVLRYASPLSESPAESFAKALLIESQTVPPESIVQQAPITAGGKNYRADMLIDAWLVIEIDGKTKYFGEDADVVEKLSMERERERAIQNAGYVVVRAGWQGLENGEFIRDVRRALRARGSTW